MRIYELMNDSMVCKRVYSADGVKLKARHITALHHVEGACDSSDATQGMKLISVIVHVLRCTVAPRGCMLYVILSPLTPGHSAFNRLKR